jgi:hypothetical protein
MQEKTKKYLEGIIKEINIGINDLEFGVQEIQKDIRKLKKFHDKVIKQM